MKLKDFDFRIWSYNTKEYLQSKNTYLAIVKDEKGLDSYEKVLDVADDCSGHDYPLYQYGDSADVEVEIFTGFRDKNDTKIYEGDVVCCLTSQGKPLYYFITSHENINTFQIFVISDLEEFKVCSEIEINNFLYCDLSNLEDMKFNIEVIGNIHNRESI